MAESTKADLLVVARLVRMSADPVALAMTVLRSLTPWPEAIRAARAIVERETSRPQRPRTPFGALAEVCDLVARGYRADPYDAAIDPYSSTPESDDR